MKAIIFASMSKNRDSHFLADQLEGDHFEIRYLCREVKRYVFQLVYFGYMTVRGKYMPAAYPEIDFTKYDEIVLVSPVWAGRIMPLMKQFLQEKQFKNKKVTIIASCKGGYKKYFQSYDGLLDESNEIVDKLVYVNRELAE